MQEIKLLKYHVILCPKDGNVQMTTAFRPRCLRCGHSWPIIDKIRGGTRGVLNSFWHPLEAADYAQKMKRNKTVMQPGFEHEV